MLRADVRDPLLETYISSDFLISLFFSGLVLNSVESLLRYFISFLIKYIHALILTKAGKYI